MAKMDNNLLNSLIIDEKNNQDLYSAGPYWKKSKKYLANKKIWPR